MSRTRRLEAETGFSVLFEKIFALSSYLKEFWVKHVINIQLIFSKLKSSCLFVLYYHKQQRNHVFCLYRVLTKNKISILGNFSSNFPCNFLNFCSYTKQLTFDLFSQKFQKMHVKMVYKGMYKLVRGTIFWYHISYHISVIFFKDEAALRKCV